MVKFQALTWDSFDSDEHLIRIFGKTIDGYSVCLSTVFQPYFFVKLPDGTTAGTVMASLCKMCPGEVVDVKIDRFKDIWGFQNERKHLFAQIFCNNLAGRRRMVSKIRRTPLGGLNVKVPIYEANVDPVLRLMHRTGIQSTGWIDTCDATCHREFHTITDIEIKCKNWKDLKPIDTIDIAPFVVASMDIECYSSTGKFPDPTVPGDACFQIAVTLVRFGTEEVYDKTCLCYKKTDQNLEGCTIRSFETERDMLMAFTEYIRRHDVDIITGWNIFGFDLNYIMKRAGMNGCSPDFFCMSKIKNHVCNISEKKLSSSALGDNVLKIVPTPGRFYFDLFHEVKRDYKLDSYKLDNVSKLYLGDRKIDMSPKEMFARFVEGDPVKLRDVAEYCIKDTLLPHRLLDKLSTLVNLLEMAKATWVPLNYLVERGQQIKVFSQLTKKAREIGYLVPTFEYGYKDHTGYVGATVLDAQSGAYYTPITALDFEALYPSIMMAHNLCYSTLVLDPRYDNLPGVTYERFGCYVFAQGVPSVLPNILSELKQFRKHAKKDMASATGASKRMFNGKQLAYKISMNSVYGFTGASVGMLPCVAIASTVTMKGRSMIEDTKNYLEEHFPGSKVRYGDTDSVMVEFDVGERKGIEAIEYSWHIGEQAAIACNSLFKKPNNLELEKVYCPYFLYSKKRYAAKLWTKNADGKMNMDYVDVKGLQLVRRDNTPHVREVCKELLDVVLASSDTVEPRALARKRALELLRGEVPHEKLVLSQQLGDSYKSSNLAHVRVRDKMRERQSGSEPQSGDRVPYLLLDTGDHRAKAFEKAEDPKYTAENGLVVDYLYYFKNKFVNPVSDLLEPLFDNSKDEIFGDIITDTKPPRKKPVRKNKLLLIDDLFKSTTP